MIIKNLTKYYGDSLVFHDISANIGETDRIGLVGPNGVGKTTLIRILNDEEPHESGEIHKAKDYRVGSLTQELVNEDVALYDYWLRSFADLIEMKQRLSSLETELGLESNISDEAALNQLMQEYAALQQQFETLGGYDYQVRIKSAGLGLGFREEEFSKKLNTLSGGEKIRAQLVRLLLSQPDLLLLDEPTNHLDVDGIEWLENYLASYPRAVLVVSHDRYFLDRVANKIWELSENTLYTYKGNYSAYVPERQQRIAHLKESAEKQQAEVAKMEAFIRKFGAGTRARQAKSLEKKLAKIEPINKPTSPDTLGFTLSPKRQTGKRVVTLTKVEKSYTDPVLCGVDGEILRGDRIALVGPNGCGKTTLLKTLAGKICFEGKIDWGVGVDMGYFSQEIEFTTDGTVLDEVYETYRAKLGVLRSVLARFLFRGDDVFKPVQVLSGGERNRLALAKLLLSEPNFLLLDEPTNHLDIYAREGLEKALLDFGGTILFVSHDRYFIDKLANKLWVMEKGTITEFVGSFSEYREQQRLNEQDSKKARQAKVEKTKRLESKAKNLAKQRDNLEDAIEKLEEEKAHLEALLGDPQLYQDERESREVLAKYELTKEKLESAYQEWETLIN